MNLTVNVRLDTPVLTPIVYRSVQMVTSALHQGASYRFVHLGRPENIQTAYVCQVTLENRANVCKSNVRQAQLAMNLIVNVRLDTPVLTLIVYLSVLMVTLALHQGASYRFVHLERPEYIQTASVCQVTLANRANVCKLNAR
jgi:hypothetical protein